MSFLSDGRFWLGLILGVAAVYGWQKYQSRKGQ